MRHYWPSFMAGSGVVDNYLTGTPKLQQRQAQANGPDHLAMCSSKRSPPLGGLTSATLFLLGKSLELPDLIDDSFEARQAGGGEAVHSHRNPLNAAVPNRDQQSKVGVDLVGDLGVEKVFHRDPE